MRRVHGGLSSQNAYAKFIQHLRSVFWFASLLCLYFQLIFLAFQKTLVTLLFMYFQKNCSSSLLCNSLSVEEVCGREAFRSPQAKNPSFSFHSNHPRTLSLASLPGENSWRQTYWAWGRVPGEQFQTDIPWLIVFLGIPSEGPGVYLGKRKLLSRNSALLGSSLWTWG